jgi:hypothetical protein
VEEITIRQFETNLQDIEMIGNDLSGARPHRRADG